MSGDAATRWLVFIGICAIAIAFFGCVDIIAQLMLLIADVTD